MKISFMTLGCPKWDLDTICRRGREYGFDGVDFRGYLDAIDITTLPMFTSGVAATRRQLDEAGLEVSAVSSSIRCARRSGARPTWKKPDAPSGGPGAGRAKCAHLWRRRSGRTSPREELAKIGRECIEEILALDGAQELHWLFETHDLWIKSTDCTLLLDAIPNPAFGALWDMGHTCRVGGEKPADTYAAIGKRVGYTHVKDAAYDPQHPQAMEDGWRYVFPGTGVLPLAESIHLLKANGYDGWLQFEHEKRWHPELAEPEEIFPAFVQWVRGVLA